jgi:hypothetical protein
MEFMEAIGSRRSKVFLILEACGRIEDSDE